MKVEVLEQKKNPLLKRDEISVSLEHTGKATPSRKEMLPELAKALKSREELLIIDKIFSVPGRNVSRARILAYKKKDEIPREKLEKMKGRMESKKAPAEAPEEKPEGGKPPGEGEAPKEGKPAKKPSEGEPARKEEGPQGGKAPEKEDKKPAEAPQEGDKKEEPGGKPPEDKE